MHQVLEVSEHAEQLEVVVVVVVVVPPPASLYVYIVLIFLIYIYIQGVKLKSRARAIDRSRAVSGPPGPTLARIHLPDWGNTALSSEIAEIEFKPIL